MLSEDYHKAVAEASAHHAKSKTYSGMFLRPHAPFIKTLIDRLGVKSVLDYGCGKGQQYEWVSHGGDTGVPEGQTLGEFWGVPVYLYDPCYQPHATAPERGRKFDLVVCTHVLGSIPTADLPVFKWEVYGWADKAVYVAEKLGPVGKQVFSDPLKFPRGWSRADWERALDPKGRPSLEVWLCTRSAPGGTVTLTRSQI